MTPNPSSWPTEGAEVVIRRPAGIRRFSYKEATVKRLTATQIVIREVSAKFRRRDFNEIGGDADLLDPADRTVQLAMAKCVEERARQAAEFALQQYQRRGYSGTAPDADDRRELRAKLSAVLAQMNVVDSLSNP